MSFGKSSSKTKTNEVTNSTSISTPNMPSAFLNPLNAYANNVSQYQNMDADAVASTVAPAGGLQRKGFQQASNLGQTWRGLLGQGADLASAASSWSPPTAAAAQAFLPAAYAPASYGAAKGRAQGYDAPRLGAAAQADWRSAGPAASASAAQIGGFERAKAHSLLEGLERYVNPMLDNVVDTSLRSFDHNAERRRAGERARRATLGNAFSDSGVAVADALTEGELALGRGSLESGLRSAAWDKAYGYSDADANRRQSASAQNSSQSLQQEMTNAQLRQQVSLDEAARRDSMAQFDAGQYGSTSHFNAGLRDKRESDQAGYEARAAEYGAEAGNRFELDHLNRQDAASRFAAENEQAARSQAYGGQVALETSNAGLRQQAELANHQAVQQTRGQTLEAAGLFGNLATSFGQQELADIGLMLSAGAAERDLEQQQRDARLNWLRAQGGLLGAIPYDAVTGRTVTENGARSGTSKTSGWTFRYDPAEIAQAAAAVMKAGG
jgi:hypothetical protein